MKKAPVITPIPRNAEEAKKHAKSASKRGMRIGKSLAQSLSQRGFKTGCILDAGCGSGEIVVELANAFPEADVVGLDLSEPLLEMARESADELKNVSFKNGDVQKMPFEDDSFDVVVSMNMLHVVDDPVAMLNEIERVLTSEGVLGLGDIKRSWAGYFMPLLKTGYTADEVKEILHQSTLRPWVFMESTFWFSVRAGRIGEVE
jgi:ubiquinone/menaquinone biosynthesis C-methylase UbiE